MGKNVKVDIRELKEFQKQIEQFQDTYDIFIESLAKEIAARLLRKVIPRTPVGNYSGQPYSCSEDGRPHKGAKVSGKSGGTLKKGWTAANKSIKVRKMIGMYEIEVINAEEYAEYVETGHRTRNHKSWVPGHFFLDISEKEIQAITPALVEKRVEQKLREMMK